MSVTNRTSKDNCPVLSFLRDQNADRPTFRTNPRPSNQILTVGVFYCNSFVLRPKLIYIYNLLGTAWFFLPSENEAWPKHLHHDSHQLRVPDSGLIQRHHGAPGRLLTPNNSSSTSASQVHSIHGCSLSPLCHHLMKHSFSGGKINFPVLSFRGGIVASPTSYN